MFDMLYCKLTHIGIQSDELKERVGEGRLLPTVLSILSQYFGTRLPSHSGLPFKFTFYCIITMNRLSAQISCFDCLDLMK